MWTSTAKHGWAEAAATAAVWLAPVVVVAAFAWVVGDIVVHGAAQLSWDFVVQPPTDAGRGGGIGPVLVSTALILMVCLATSVPVGLGTAVLLAEFTPRHNRFGGAVRGALDVLAGVPSIVYGLFGNAFFGVVLGMGYSLLAGGLTLACMVLPLLIRSTEAGIRAVPAEYRLGAAALGFSHVATLRRVVLPAARPALVAGLVLGLGRALAETAALLFTSGYVARMPGSLLDSGRALSVHVFDLAMNVPGGDQRAYGSALVLLLLLLAVNSVVGWISGRWGRVALA